MPEVCIAMLCIASYLKKTMPVSSGPMAMRAASLAKLETRPFLNMLAMLTALEE